VGGAKERVGDRTSVMQRERGPEPAVYLGQQPGRWRNDTGAVELRENRDSEFVVSAGAAQRDHARCGRQEPGNAGNGQP
jgi:hypothetical protein